MNLPIETDATQVSGDVALTSEGSHIAPRSPAVRLRRRLAAFAWPFGVFIVSLGLTFWYERKAWAHPGETWFGGRGDPEGQIWFLRWPLYALEHAGNPLLTNHILYPSGTNLMWNTSDVAPGLFFAPLTAIAGPVVTYSVLVVLAPPVAALTAYAAFHRWANRPGAAAGGLLFAFCPYMLAHSAGHLHVIMLASLPLVLLLLDEIVVRQSWRWWAAGAALGLVAATQLLTSEEILALDALFAVLGIAVLALLHHQQVREKLAYAARAGATALAVFLALGAYPLYIQFRGSNRVSAAIHGNNVIVTDLLNPVLPVNQRIRPDWVVKYVLRFSGDGAEWTGYIGIPLLVILLLLLILRWRRPVVMFAAIMGTLALVFSFGPWLHIGGHEYHFALPWTPFAKMPVLRQVVPGRISIVVTLFVALGLALAITEVMRSGRWWLKGLGAIGVILVILAWLPRSLPSTRVATPAYFTSSAVNQIPRGSLALVLPYIYSNPSQDAMLWQAQAGMRFRMVEGWAIVPGDHAGSQSQTRTTFSMLTPATTHVPDQAAAKIRQELGTWRVQTVIVGPWLEGDPRTEDSAVDVVEQVLGRAPQRQGGVYVWYDVRL